MFSGSIPGGTNTGEMPDFSGFAGRVTGDRNRDQVFKGSDNDEEGSGDDDTVVGDGDGDGP